jgi:Na+-driven multidrug efflux pump
MFYIPASFGFAISALVGGAIGSGNARKAKRIVLITLIMSSGTILFIIALTMSNLRNIVAIYLPQDSEKPEIFEMVVSNLGAYCLIYILDGYQVILQSTIKGLGLQSQA